MASDPAQRDEPEDSAQTEIEDLIRQNGGWMLRLAERILNDPALAEDAVQDALINAVRGLPSFENQSSLKTWLHRITINAALSKLRKRKSLAEHSIDELLPQFDQNDCRLEQPWSKLASVQEVIESEEQRAQIERSIRALPDAYRIVLQLRDVDGYDTSETAELLETTPANVKVRLHRARAALKKLLEPVLRGEMSL